VPVSLTTEEIDYATSGTRGVGPFRRIPRRQVRDPLRIDDIKGTRSNNTIRSTMYQIIYKGYQSKIEGSYQRNTDPLDPDYDNPRSNPYLSFMEAL